MNLSENYSTWKENNWQYRNIKGQEILKSEVEIALAELNRYKSVLTEGIAIEMLAVLTDIGIDMFTDIVNEIYSSSSIPEDLSSALTKNRKCDTAKIRLGFCRGD